MKILKLILKGIGILLGISGLFIAVVLILDLFNTSYLKIDKNDHGAILIKNVNIIPMTQDTILEHKMILLKDGMINQISDEINSENAEVIDGKNKYLIPGLIDMHVHVWDKYELGVYLANGVTTVRNLWGMPMHLRMKEAINNDEIYAPMFYTAGPKLTGPEFIGDDNLQLFSAEEGRNKVISYKKRGYDFIKTYYGLTPEIFDAIIQQANKSDMDIVAHPSQKVPYAYHFNPQIKSIEHAEDIVQIALNYTMDTVKLKSVINDFKNAPNSSFCPTLTVYNNIYQMLIHEDILNTEQLQYLNPIIRKTDSQAQFDRWHNTKLQDSSIVQKVKDQHDFQVETIKKLHDAGVNIVCGTDAGIGVTAPGISIHRELAFYKEAGLSNYEVLKTATINASKVHQLMNGLGSVEAGKVANLLLVDSNPLEDLNTLKYPELVIIKGKSLVRSKLNSFVEKAKNRKNLLATGIRYAENLIVEK